MARKRNIALAFAYFVPLFLLMCLAFVIRLAVFGPPDPATPPTMTAAIWFALVFIGGLFMTWCLPELKSLKIGKAGSRMAEFHAGVSHLWSQRDLALFKRAPATLHKGIAN